jgi:hypothetical protein
MSIKTRIEELERKTAATAGPVVVKGYSACCNPDSWGGTSDPATCGYATFSDEDIAAILTTLDAAGALEDVLGADLARQVQEASHAND